MPHPLRIAHCSDLHLDGDGYSPDNQSPSALFEKTLQQIKKSDPHLLLIAGDLFDSNRADDSIVLWAMRVLESLPFKVFVIPGNHDCMQPNGVFERHDFNAIENVVMLANPNGEIVWAEDHGVAIWGKAMVSHTPEYRPLSNCPARPEGCDWYLGMGHGLFVGNEKDSERSSPITLQEVEESPCDYVALGHHHAAMEIVTDMKTAAYSGSPTDNIGKGHTFALVKLTKGLAPVLNILTLE